ncbi:MAG: hypothetical protein HY927_00660 [Elusimicrobia bacterium]|nr:hypothetical protein [Elusimicrobiota bacterium]
MMDDRGADPAGTRPEPAALRPPPEEGASGPRPAFRSEPGGGLKGLVGLALATSVAACLTVALLSPDARRVLVRQAAAPPSASDPRTPGADVLRSPGAAGRSGSPEAPGLRPQPVRQANVEVLAGRGAAGPGAAPQLPDDPSYLMPVMTPGAPLGVPVRAPGKASDGESPLPFWGQGDEVVAIGPRDPAELVVPEDQAVAVRDAGGPEPDGLVPYKLAPEPEARLAAPSCDHCPRAAAPKPGRWMGDPGGGTMAQVKLVGRCNDRYIYELRNIGYPVLRRLVSTHGEAWDVRIPRGGTTKISSSRPLSDQSYVSAR